MSCKIELVISFLAFLCVVSSQTAKSTYRAAVVEYSPEWSPGDIPENILSQSAINYISYIEDAAKQDTDIIVFPEVGLSGIAIPADRKKILRYTTRVPAVEDANNSCDTMLEVMPWFKKLACAAKKNKIYVVINLPEAYPCLGKGKCPEDGVFIYNTNVVFNRQGVIVARYRKFNLFIEPGFDVTNEPEMSTFETDFGVTFGMFICFDILFKSPAEDLIRLKKVHDIVYSTAWFSELPFLTAVQVQAAWAYENGATLIAAGYDNPANSNGGSGIYLGRAGAAVEYMPFSRSNKLMIADVPKVPTLEKPQKLEVSLDAEKYDDIQFANESLKAYTTQILDAKATEIHLCNNQLCCSFDYEISNPESTDHVYRAVVFDGVRDYANIVHAGLQVCGVVFCSNKEIESCGIRDKNPAFTGATFTKLSVEGKFRKTDKTLQLPNTVDFQALPLDPTHYDYANDEISFIKIKNTTNRLFTFGIYLRDFALDTKIVHKVIEDSKPTDIPISGKNYEL